MLSLCFSAIFQMHERMQERSRSPITRPAAAMLDLVDVVTLAGFKKSEYLGFMKKSDAVVNLLKHLPYIRHDTNHDPYQIYETTSGVDYSGDNFRTMGVKYQDPTAGDPYKVVTVLPSHVATIATIAGGRDGYYFFLDTERGTVTRCDFQDGPGWGTGLEEVMQFFSKGVTNPRGRN